MKNYLAIILLSLALSTTTKADIVVIGRQDGPEGLTVWKVSGLFLGRSRTLPSGEVATMVELSPISPYRREFHEQYLGRTESQILSSWTRALFTRDIEPPIIVKDYDEVINEVKSGRNIIGYIDDSLLTPGIKVLLRKPKKIK